MSLSIVRAEDLPAPHLDTLFHYRATVFHDVFGWDIPVTNGKDRDDWDNRALRPIYFIDADPHDDITGCARLLPTTASYMLRDLPVFRPLTDGPSPASPRVWEISRLTAYSPTAGRVDPRATGRLLRALLEFALLNEIYAYLCVVEPLFARRLSRLGIPLEPLGPLQSLGGVEAGAFRIPIDPRTITAVRRLGDDWTEGLEIGESLTNLTGASIGSAFAG